MLRWARRWGHIHSIVCTLALVTCKRSLHLGLRFFHQVQMPSMGVLETREQPQIGWEDPVLASGLRRGEGCGCEEMRPRLCLCWELWGKKQLLQKAKGLHVGSG